VRVYMLSLKDISIQQQLYANLWSNMIMPLEVEQKKNLKLILVRWTLYICVGQPRPLKTNSKVGREKK
jgi:hypothetical protein